MTRALIEERGFNSCVFVCIMGESSLQAAWVELRAVRKWGLFKNSSFCDREEGGNRWGEAENEHKSLQERAEGGQ